jgi:hypothetical protein
MAVVGLALAIVKILLLRVVVRKKLELVLVMPLGRECRYSSELQSLHFSRRCPPTQEPRAFAVSENGDLGLYTYHPHEGVARFTFDPEVDPDAWLNLNAVADQLVADEVHRQWSSDLGSVAAGDYRKLR